MNGETIWSAVLTTAEEFEELRRANRSDGVLTPEEDDAETAYLRSRLVAGIADCHETLAIVQVIGHRGPESPRAQRLLAARRKRLAEATPFPGDRFGLGDGDAVQLEAA